MPGELQQDMENCRQTTGEQRRGASRLGENGKQRIIVLAACTSALLVLGVGILLAVTRFNQANPIKQSCPEGVDCNVKVRSYETEVLTDKTDILPSWFPETPSITPMQPTTLQTAPMAVLQENTNCRKGPGTLYAIAALLQQGSTASLVGRNSDWSWWLIQPSDGWLQCWVWSGLVTTNDDIKQVPFVTSLPPPTMTSTPEPQQDAQIGCWVFTNLYPNGICLPRACGENDYPGTPCTP